VPVDIIKIDKSFVSQLQVDDRSVAIVSGLLDIARKLDIRVIAEGIETEDQAKLLAEIGCGLGQGYLFSAAVAPQSATELLMKHAQHSGKEKAEPLYGTPDRFVAGRAIRKQVGRAKKAGIPVSDDSGYVAPASRAI